MSIPLSVSNVASSLWSSTQKTFALDMDYLPASTTTTTIMTTDNISSSTVTENEANRLIELASPSSFFSSPSSSLYSSSSSSSSSLSSSFSSSTSMNAYYEEQFNFVMSGVVVPIFCIPGMFGNALAVMVWSRPVMCTSTGRYLTAQAVIDFFVLLFYLLNDTVQAWAPQFVFGAPYGYYYSYVGFPGYSFSVICHVWFTVGVTVDLCVMVCWVLKSKTFCNTKVATTFVTTLATLGFLINIPYIFYYRPTTTTTTTTNTTTDTTILQSKPFQLSGFGDSTNGLYYGFFVHCVLLVVIPWTLVLTMSVKVISKIVSANRRMADKKSSQSVKNSKQTESQIRRLQMGVTFSFVLFVGINCVVHCTWMMNPPTINKQLINSCFMFAKTGIVFNAACHYLFYCLLSKRFRTELKKVVCITSSSTSNPNSSSTMSHSTNKTQSSGNVD